MHGIIDLPAFEQWVYTDKELGRELTDDFYLDLLALNYKKSGAKYELFHLLEQHVNMGEYGTYKLKWLLDDARQRTLELPGKLEQFYDLYCNGYSFLGVLGMGYGLLVNYLSPPYKVERWDELTQSELAELVDSFSPHLEVEIDRVERWLNTGKIILTGEINELGHYMYIDNRTTDERQVRFDFPVFNEQPKR